MYKRIKHALFGHPIASQHAEHQKLNIPLGLAVFSSDALSSTAYATDEILLALSTSIYAAQTSLLSLPVALAIVALIALVVISYRQVIQAYPQGGGAYIVAKENLGTLPSHIAAAALLIDYVLTVAVSISAGIAAITSTGLIDHQAVTLTCLGCVAIIMLVNLRGVKESGKAFAIPAYVFLASMFALIVVGLTKLPHVLGGVSGGALLSTETSFHWTNLTLGLVLLKAFSHGCAGLTGIEAVSNGVKAFKDPSARYANTTMAIMGIILSFIFLGITFLAFGFHVVPAHDETILSQVARTVFGAQTPMYYLVQLSTMVMLVLAANTAFADFPRVANLLANDGFLPRQLMNVGDRLVFNNGILILGLMSMLLIWLFTGDTHMLIPLYAVGVFVSFTLSQSGMVRHHLVAKQKGWQYGIGINAFGALVTFIVTIILAIEKFTEGAWIVLVAIPLIIWIFQSIKRHYQLIGRQLSLTPDYTCLSPTNQKVLVLVSNLGKGTIPALKYAQSLGAEVEAVHVAIQPEFEERLKHLWGKWGEGIPLKTLPSPYRNINEPLLDYIHQLRQEAPEQWVTVVVPEFVTKKLWHNFLHNQTALTLKALLRSCEGVIVTTVRFHLSE